MKFILNNVVGTDRNPARGRGGAVGHREQLITTDDK